MPKVVTKRCLEQDSNPRPTDRKPKCLTRCTTAPLHRAAITKSGGTLRATISETMSRACTSMVMSAHSTPRASLVSSPRTSAASLLRSYIHKHSHTGQFCTRAQQLQADFENLYFTINGSATNSTTIAATLRWFTAGGAIRIAHYDVIDDVITRKL